jgi:lysophospholipase L1-like esterase
MTVMDLPSDVDHARLLADAPWRRIVVVGDSVAAGVREPKAGWPDRSWTDWIGAALPDAEMLNLGRRFLLAREVREQQLAAALAFDPDLVIVSAGGNDMMRRDFDERALWAELSALVAPLRQAGADLLMHEYLDWIGAGMVPDAYREIAAAKALAHTRVVRQIAGMHGAMLVEMRSHPADAELWASDRIHLNAHGHAIVGAESVRTMARRLASRRHPTAA